MSTPCEQVQNIEKLKTDTLLISKDIQYMNQKVDQMDKKIDKNHNEIKELINELKTQWETKSKDFVLKSSFNVAIWVVTVLATLIWLITYFLDKK